MTTRAMYYEQPYLKTLEAKVLALGEKGVILDRTICYPEGGGQPGDRGSLGGCVLLDTVKDDNKQIFHKVKDPPFSVGDQVTIMLDWTHRYHYMCMHTAQHIASGVLYSQFKIGTVSVHQGEKFLTIETDASYLGESRCYQIEDAVNKAIGEAHAVHYEVHTHKEAQALGLRRSIKVQGDEIRLVIIDDIDTIACGGLHTANTSEVGLFQYVSQEKLRGHIRLVFSIGVEALAEIRENRRTVASLCSLYSAQRETLVEVAEASLHQASQDRSLLQRKEQRLAEVLLASLVQTAEKKNGVPLVFWEVPEDLDFKQVSQAFASIPDLALCAAKEEKGRLLWMVALGGNASLFLDFNQVRVSLLAPIEGKGGGRPPVWQGVGKGKVAEFFKSFRNLL